MSEAAGEIGSIFSGSSADSAAMERVLAEVRALGLQDNLIELETQGYTTLPAVLNEDLIERTKAAILRRAAHDNGQQVDPETATADDVAGMTYMPYMLYDDEVFEEVLMAPKPLALITYLLGESCVLSSIGCHFKGPGEDGAIPLHSDNGNGIPSPFPPYSLVANVNYALTPYSREAGALAVVPRSHVYARQPNTGETALSGARANPAAVSMDLNPG